MEGFRRPAIPSTGSSSSKGVNVISNQDDDWETDDSWRNTITTSTSRRGSFASDVVIREQFTPDTQPKNFEDDAWDRTSSIAFIPRTPSSKVGSTVGSTTGWDKESWDNDSNVTGTSIRMNTDVTTDSVLGTSRNNVGGWDDLNAWDKDSNFTSTSLRIASEVQGSTVGTRLHINTNEDDAWEKTSTFVGTTFTGIKRTQAIQSPASPTPDTPASPTPSTPASPTPENNFPSSSSLLRSHHDSGLQFYAPRGSVFVGQSENKIGYVTSQPRHAAVDDEDWDAPPQTSHSDEVIKRTPTGLIKLNRSKNFYPILTSEDNIALIANELQGRNIEPSEWSVSEVKEFIIANGYHVQAFDLEKAKIDGLALIELTKNKLSKIRGFQCPMALRVCILFHRLRLLCKPAFIRDRGDQTDFRGRGRGGGRGRGRGSFSGGGGSACFKCGEEGHMSRECPTGGSGGNNKCYKCSGTGHIARDCSNEASGDVGSYSRSKGNCYKCGEEGHISRDCKKDKGDSCGNNKDDDDGWGNNTNDQKTSFGTGEGTVDWESSSQPPKSNFSTGRGSGYRGRGRGSGNFDSRGGGRGIGKGLDWDDTSLQVGSNTGLGDSWNKRGNNNNNTTVVDDDWETPAANSKQSVATDDDWGSNNNTYPPKRPLQQSNNQQDNDDGWGSTKKTKIDEVDDDWGASSVVSSVAPKTNNPSLNQSFGNQSNTAAATDDDDWN